MKTTNKIFKYPENSGSTPRVRRCIARNAGVTPELFPFRALAATRSHRSHETDPLVIRRAKMFRDILKYQPVVIREGEVIVGMKTPKPHGSPVFPEINCDWLERDIDLLPTRTNTPFAVSPETRKALVEEVFPYWKNRQVYSQIAAAVPESILRADARGAIYNYFASRTIGHITVAYDKVLTRGITGIQEEVKTAAARLKKGTAGVENKRLFYEAIRISLEAIAAFAHRYANEAATLANSEKDASRKAELLTIAEVCRRVPQNPARNFHEALQSFYFTQLALNLETNGHAISPGRFDQYIYPFYRKSITAGEMAPNTAQELMDLLWIKLDEITLAKDSGESDTSCSYPEFQNLNIGGLTPEGHDAVNDVSYMCLTALEHVRLPQPQLSAQISSKTTPKFLLRCCELLGYGLGMPAMFNSDTMVLGMVNRGKTLKDARTGSINGCVSPNCGGLDRMASSGYFNLAKCLELALCDGRDRFTGEQLGPQTGPPETFSDFTDLLEAFRSQIAHFVKIKVTYDDIVRRIYAEHCPVPVTSALIDDCIAKGIDWHSGGARYNQAVISGVGLGTVTDALSAIRTHVYEKKRLSLAELNQVLDSDFESHDVLYHTLQNKTPHYGNDNDLADELAQLVQRLFSNEVEKYRDYQGGQYWVNLLPTTAHIALGHLTGATPDGRKSGKWLSEGISPVQGHDRKGPTAAANSVGKLDHARCNGNLLNMKVSPQMLKNDDGLHKLAALIRGYFDQGGHHVQFNIVDQKILRQAQEAPELYQNLLVRVAGYSDYFTVLTPDIQNEIMQRTEHRL